MLETLTLSGFFLMGLFVGLGHCTGMCSPFVFWLAGVGQEERPRTWTARLWPQIQYHVGRIFTYSLLGLVAGFLGSVVDLAGSLGGLAQATALVAGVLLVLYAGAAIIGQLPFTRIESLDFVQRKVAKLLSRPPRRAWLAGLLLGLLPCGPLYGALIAAAGFGLWWKGAAAMALFGLGTAPALLLLGLLGNWLAKRRGLLYGVSLVLILGMGFYFIWQAIKL